MASLLIAGNWKMNTTLQEASELVANMKPRLEAIADVQTVLCPPFVSLPVVAELLRGSEVALGAQNMHHEGRGAFTGEISPAMVKELCEFVILGHSERRQLFAESDELVSQKLNAAIGVGLRPIVCVGEHLRERDEGRANEVVETQLTGSLAALESTGPLVVAYEPVWAIGTGRAATPDVAQAMMAHIRQVLGALYGDKEAAAVPLLYGGSVNPGNTSEYMGQHDIDGALVGGASLDADTFVEIVEIAAVSKA